MLLIHYVLYYLLQDSKTFPLARVHHYTSVLELEVSLTYHGKKARLSLRAMASPPSKKNLGLVNPRWRMYIDFLKKVSINSRKE